MQSAYSPGHRPVALPAVGRHYPAHTLGHGPAPLAHPIRRRKRGAHHMKPPRATARAKPGLVRMLHTRLAGRQLLHMPARSTQTLRRPTAHTRQGRRRHARPEQHTRRLRQPPLRQKPTMTKPHRNARKTRTIPNRTRYTLRKQRPRHLTATPAAAGMTAVRRHFQPTRLRKVEYPTRYRTTDRSDAPQPRHTAGTCSFTRSGRPVRQSVRPSCPPDRPAAGPSCPSGSASDAPPQASSTHRSMEACRYCRRSDRDGAPTPPAALQHAQPDPEAARSPTQHAQPSPPQSL